MLCLVACGPTVGDDEGGVGDDTSSGGTAQTSGTSGADSGDGAEATSAMGTASTGVDATGSSSSGELEDLPPEAVGAWLCTGWEDPLFVNLMIDAAQIWSGSLCTPEAGSTDDPSSWTNCSELQAHGEVFPSQSYWAGELPYAQTATPVPFELQFDYVPSDDTATGVFFPGSPPTIEVLACTRWLPD